MSANQQLEQNKREQPVSIIAKVVSIGFFGGIFWSFIGWIASYFHFTSMSPASYFIRSWLHASWTNSWLAEAISILGSGLLSIAVAIIYYVALKKLRGLWPSILFGLFLWGLVFFLFSPILPNIKPLQELDSDTIVTTLCLYILYGIFIGYSISYEYLDTITKKNI